MNSPEAAAAARPSTRDHKRNHVNTQGNESVQRFRGGLVFKAHRLCVSVNSRLASNKEEEEE